MEYTAGNFGGLSALRALRILRVFKLAKNWDALQSFLNAMFASMLSVGPFCLLVLIMCFIFTLLGMQLFGGNLDDVTCDGRPRPHFDTFVWAFVTTFQVRNVPTK